jgi:hypothetical protein
MFKLKYILVFLLPVIFPVPSLAVNFYDGAKPKKGLYWLTYSSLYYADKTTDDKGKTSRQDYGYRKTEELIRLCYYTPEAVLTVLVPAGRVKSGFYDVSSRGIGDINLGAGYFLPVKLADVLPMLFVKFPTGEYDSSKSVNYGTNQYDFKPTVFIYKAHGRFSLDAALKYHFRQENPATNISPGDELFLQCLLGWQFTKNCKAGPSINWMKSGNQENGGIKIADSRRETLSLGADLYFRLPAFGLTLTYLRDLRSKNTTKGDFFQVKTCYKF